MLSIHLQTTIVGPISLVVIMTVLGIILSRTMMRTDAALNHLITSLDQKSSVLSRIERDLTEIQGETYRLVGLHGRNVGTAQLQDIGQQVQEHILAVRGHLQALLHTCPLTDAEREADEQVIIAVDAYLVSVRKMVEALDAEIPVAAIFIVGVEQSYDKLRRTLSVLTELDRETNQRVYAAALKTTRYGQLVILLLVGIAVGLGVGLTALSSVNIHRPIMAITQAMSRLAQERETDLQVPGIERRDEIGHMAQALEVFKADAVEKICLLAEVQERTANIERVNASLQNEIRAREQAEAQIARHNEALERAVHQTKQEMKTLMERMVRQGKLATIGQVAGSIAHELRNPLGAIKQSVFFLHRLSRRGAMVSTNPKVDEHLQLMGGEVDTANRVITQLLAFARNQPSTPEWLELRSLVEEGLRPVRQLEQVQLELICEPNPFVLWADRWQMQHVLMNLLSNAIDACETSGTVTIRAYVDAVTQAYILMVVDTGCGMSTEEAKHVFQPLYSTKVWGTGLGLSLCRQLVEQQGGDIVFHSRKGEGTTVTIRLPLGPTREMRTRPVAAEAHTIPLQTGLEAPCLPDGKEREHHANADDHSHRRRPSGHVSNPSGHLRNRRLHRVRGQ